MTPLKQLFRQPLRLTAICLLLGMASAFFCLSAGVFAAAKTALEQVEQNYVTIGVPTTETVDVTTEYNGMTLHREESVISSEMWAYMDELAAEGSIIKGAYQQRYISAYSPSVQTVTSSKEDGMYKPHLDDPYDRAIFVVRITSVEQTRQFGNSEQVFVGADASIEEIVMLHPDYSVRGKLRLSIGCNSQEELDALAIEPGKKYLVFGSDYRDRDLELRTLLANANRCSVAEIDLSQISYALTEDELKAASPDFQPVAMYSSGEEKGTLLSQNMLDDIDSCSMTITDWHGLFPEDQPVYAIDGTETGTLVNDQYLDVYMTPLNTDLDTFLSSDAGAEWQHAVQELETQYHAVSVIGTDFLESMYSFHQKDSFITEGRHFSDDEYKSGSNVCLISEATATASGLGIGDTIDLSFYWGPNPLADLTTDPQWNMQPQRFSQKTGFSGEARAYQIVGIYRQSNLWDTAAYRFSPNTVIVPNASLPGNCYTSRTGAFFTYVLRNGTIPELQESFQAQNYPASILACLDNGYSEIADTLQGFYSSTVQLFFASCLSAVVALFVFLVLFVNRQRRNVGLMLSLGSGKKSAIWFNWRVSAVPVVLSTIAGVFIGILVMRAVTESLLSSALEILDTSLSSGATTGYADVMTGVDSMPVAVIAGGIFQLGIFLTATYLYLKQMSKQSPLSLMRKG